MTKKPTQLHLMLPITSKSVASSVKTDEAKAGALVNEGKYTYKEVITKLSNKGLVKSRSRSDSGKAS